mmetsp:Transcript_5407/g.17108  ORF Transcript_5407/g.17108 Transcript_5407/m.17108 type:complete len:292 (-) Transcript_5407:996-1871(-)
MADPEMLLLDPAIRDWVVLPMVAIMVLMGLCRHYALILLKSNTKMDAAEMQQRQVLMRAARIRTRGQLLPAESFHARRSYLCAKESGVLCVKVKKSGNNPMMNPLGMVDQMKGNMVYMVPNMAMMGIISFFFQGFVLVKVPFPLTQRFKIMLQRGVDLESLDVSYVSSLSWYFLVMFGLRGFFKILLGEDSDALDEARSTQMQMGMGMGGGGGGVFFEGDADVVGEGVADVFGGPPQLEDAPYAFRDLDDVVAPQEHLEVVRVLALRFGGGRGLRLWRRLDRRLSVLGLRE